jgi:hypothetical protein
MGVFFVIVESFVALLFCDGFLIANVLEIERSISLVEDFHSKLTRNKRQQIPG